MKKMILLGCLSLAFSVTALATDLSPAAQLLQKTFQGATTAFTDFSGGSYGCVLSEFDEKGESDSSFKVEIEEVGDGIFAFTAQEGSRNQLYLFAKTNDGLVYGDPSTTTVIRAGNNNELVMEKNSRSATMKETDPAKTNPASIALPNGFQAVGYGICKKL